MESLPELAQMDAEQLRNLTAALLAQLAEREAQIIDRDAEISRRNAEISQRNAEISQRDAEINAQQAVLASRNNEIKAKQLKIDQLTHEMATLRRYRFGRHSEQLDVVQCSLLDEMIDADIEAISLEIEALKLPSVPKLKENRGASRCRHPSRAEKSPMSPTKPSVAAAVAWCESARISAKNSTTRRVSSRSRSTSAASGSAANASA